MAVSALADDARIAHGLGAARAAWPGIRISDEVFFHYVVERMSTDGLVDIEPVAQNTQDLFLACACSSGDQAAIAAFEELYFVLEVDAACRRSSNVAPDEVRQRVRAKLFVGPSPKITLYAGRSSLRAWLRAVVGRLVIDVSREAPRDVPSPESDFRDLAASGDGPDGILIKQTYQEALEEAFGQAAARLSDRDKNLLRYGLAEGLTIDQIGRIYGVHRVTAARWLQKARESFVEHVQAVMMERLKLSASEFDSVLRLVLSQIDVTMARVFAPSE